MKTILEVKGVRQGTFTNRRKDTHGADVAIVGELELRVEERKQRWKEHMDSRDGGLKPGGPDVLRGRGKKPDWTEDV